MTRYALALLLLCPVAVPLHAQTRTDSARVRAEIARLVYARDNSNNSRRVKDSLQVQIDAQARYFDYAKVEAPPPPPPPPVNAPPLASAGVSCVPASRLCSASSIGSRDDKAITGTRWNWGDGATSTAVNATHTYATYGTRTVTLVVTDASGLADTATALAVLAAPAPPPDTVVVKPPPVVPPKDSVLPLPPPVVPPPVVPDTNTSTTPTRAELPRPWTLPVFPKAARTVKIAPPMDLQKALDASVAGDSLSLTGAYTGNFVLPTRPCGAGISIVGAAPLPSEGMRVTPPTATGYPRITTPNNLPALRAASPTCGWRIVGVEMTGTLVGTQIQYGLVALGDGGWAGGGEVQTSMDKVPAQIVLDRVWIHGSATLNTMRCVAVNSASTVIINSWISDCHAKGFDSQSVEGWNGPGPYLIENNTLEGAGENVMFGGADPGIRDLIPSDITIRRNHIRKPLDWKGQWSIKNLLELKNARRVLVEANVLENSWIDAQMGIAVAFKSTTDVCGNGCLWEGTTDVTFQYNWVGNAQRAFNLQAYDNSYTPTGSNNHVARVAARNNLFTNIGAANGVPPADGWLLLLTHDLKDVDISRNTFISNAPGYGLAVVTAYSEGNARRVKLDSNVFAGKSYYAIRDDGGLHAAGLRAFAGTSWSFRGNVVSQVNAEYVAANPAGNVYVDAIAKLGLTPDGAFSSTSAYRASGAGADIPEITRRIAGVVVVPPASAVAKGARPVKAVTPILTARDSAWVAHQPRSVGKEKK